MRYWFALCALLALSACAPADPTGYVVAPAFDGERSLISYRVLDASREPAPVRIEVRGDVVADSVYVGDQRVRLSGDRVADGWLADRGVAVAWLRHGEYRVVAYSCRETFTGYRCGCEGDSCGNYVGRRILVQ